MKTLIFFIVYLLVSGCVSNNVQQNNIVEATQKGTLDALNGKHIYRLDYFIDDNSYIYATFEIKNKYRYFSILAKNKKIVAYSEITIKGLYSPDIRKCTLFPYPKGSNAKKCLSEFNVKTLNSNTLNLIEELTKLNQDEKSRRIQEKHESVASLVVFSPLVAPLIVLQAPLSAIEYSSEKSRKESFTLKLGHNANLKQHISTLNSKAISRFNSSGTAYIESGLFNTPAIAFGFIKNEVIWIQSNPKWSCGGGFIFWDKCSIGVH
jgi:hypothetical protein